MWANNAIAIVIRILAVPVNLLGLFTTFVGGLIMAIPLVGLVFVLLLSLIWMPFLGLLIATAWFWHNAPPGIRSLSALLGIPVAIVGNTFLTLMPGGTIEDMPAKRQKQIICQDWPYPYRHRDGGMMLDVLRRDEGLSFVGVIVRWAELRYVTQINRLPWTG